METKEKNTGMRKGFTTGTCAAAASRAAAFMLITGQDLDRIDLKWKAAEGKIMDVVVDGYDEEIEQYFGRTYADSPDIDGRVWLASDEDLSEGTFVKVQIDGVVEGDLSGFVVEV